jgi:hypothetical protein
MQTHPIHTYDVADRAARRRHREFWLAVIVALIVLLACTGPTAGSAGWLA